MIISAGYPVTYRQTFIFLSLVPANMIGKKSCECQCQWSLAERKEMAGNNNNNTTSIPVSEVYWSLVDKADKKFSKIRDLPYYQRNRWFSLHSSFSAFLFHSKKISWYAETEIPIIGLSYALRATQLGFLCSVFVESALMEMKESKIFVFSSCSWEHFDQRFDFLLKLFLISEFSVSCGYFSEQKKKKSKKQFSNTVTKHVLKF